MVALENLAPSENLAPPAPLRIHPPPPLLVKLPPQLFKSSPKRVGGDSMLSLHCARFDAYRSCGSGDRTF